MVLLPPPVLNVLITYRNSCTSRWMFPSPVKEDSPTDPVTIQKRLSTVLKRADCKRLRFHDLRHTFATHALASGVDAKTLSGILGHTKASFTLDTYTHVTGDMHRNAAEIVGDFMTELLGEEMEPWQSSKSGETAVST